MPWRERFKWGRKPAAIGLLEKVAKHSRDVFTSSLDFPRRIEFAVSFARDGSLRFFGGFFAVFLTCLFLEARLSCFRSRRLRKIYPMRSPVPMGLLSCSETHRLRRKLRPPLRPRCGPSAASFLCYAHLIRPTWRRSVPPRHRSAGSPVRAMQKYPYCHYSRWRSWRRPRRGRRATLHDSAAMPSAIANRT